MKNKIFSIALATIVASSVFFSSCKKIKIGKCCSDDAAYFFENDSSFFALPNIFSPNGDGQNDILRGFGKGVANYIISVHKTNLFETKVFESSDISMGWDGTFKGKHLAESAYKCSIKVTLQSGQQYSYDGKVCLVRNKIDSENCNKCKWATQFDGKQFNLSMPSSEILCN